MIILRTKRFGFLSDIWESMKSGKSLENKIKDMNDFIKRNYNELELIVKKNLPTNSQLLKLSQFEKESNELFEEVDNCGYEILTYTNIDNIVKELGEYLYIESRKKTHYVIPGDHPIPILSICGYMDLTEKTYSLWFSKKTGWVDNNARKYSGPKQFILDCIKNKIDTFEVEDEEWFSEYYENFIKLINKYLW